ncbi:secreted LysM domain-containing protein [Phycomyces blakesleeanus]|uniref:Secreted LysM domain-containing protein n=2 Tax=Phycomyces blakesleeanus TaxID=4837 RepID=A0A162XXF5_PHYB8|nr:secreted LysM domain-containing protein [Phycomyces blakesleeanus NRRL 1555(-)]OAD77095.1 secreted LysM domain-containing protein [Phycomyces blakesleeanus NRRL 1555(-)]|eukprot:XP_018295135.1 secreted LysM domain-containing protein [Phycomyces blakesleeanus NRRL 1555(-)]
MKFSLLAVSAFFLATMVAAAPSTVCTGKHVATKGETCASMAKHYKISVKNLQQWNSGLGSNVKKCSKITTGKSYCVKRGPKKVTTKKTTTKKSTTKKTTTKKTTTKKTTTKKSTTTKASPATSTNGLHLAPHTDPNCKKYYVVVDGDGCDTAAKKNGITEAQLYKWNTGLHHAGDHLCDNLDTGRAYCVKV